jgi:hypothetical protein
MTVHQRSIRPPIMFTPGTASPFMLSRKLLPVTLAAADFTSPESSSNVNHLRRCYTTLRRDSERRLRNLAHLSILVTL